LLELLRIRRELVKVKVKVKVKVRCPGVKVCRCEGVKV
jgi:hypothetical protein